MHTCIHAHTHTLTHTHTHASMHTHTHTHAHTHARTHAHTHTSTHTHTHTRTRTRTRTRTHARWQNSENIGKRKIGAISDMHKLVRVKSAKEPCTSAKEPCISAKKTNWRNIRHARLDVLGDNRICKRALYIRKRAQCVCERALYMYYIRKQRVGCRLGRVESAQESYIPAKKMNWRWRV